MPKAKYTKGKDGRYQTKVWDGTYKEGGAKHYIPVYSTKSSADLERMVDDIKRSVADRSYVAPCDDTFLAYARQWRTIYKAVRSENTKAMYNNIIEKHMIALKGLKLQDVNHSHFQMLINTNVDQPRTCQQIAITFKQIIRAAIKDKKLPAADYNDICSDIDMPKYVPNEKRPLTPEEKEAVKVADFTPMEKAFVYLIFGTGLRRGEALAQTIFTVNLKKGKSGEVFVGQAVAFKVNDPYIKSTKNEKTRSVPIPAFARDYLELYVKSIPGPYLFTKRDGNMMTKSSYDKMWASIINKINRAAGGSDELQVVFDLTAHVFRHNFCTSLCYKIPEISIKKIAQLMGDTEKMVLEVYNHIMDEKEDAQGVVDKALIL